MRWGMLLPALIVAGICLLFDAREALAWGPGTHLLLGSDLLSHAAWLPAGAAAIILRCRQHFLYGNLAADVVLAKRLSRIKQFCHHWVDRPSPCCTRLRTTAVGRSLTAIWPIWPLIPSPTANSSPIKSRCANRR